MVFICNWIDLYGRKNIVEIFFHYNETCVRFYIAKKFFTTGGLCFDFLVYITLAHWVVYSLGSQCVFI